MHEEEEEEEQQAQKEEEGNPYHNPNTHTITYNLLFCILNLFMLISFQRRRRISVRSQTPSPQPVIAKPLAAGIYRYVESFVVCS
jgi:hypothetical protein